MKKERKEYEQKYLSRYKQPKLGVKKLSNLKHDIDLGTLTLRQYVNAKRKTKQDEIKKYEQKYLSRYKQNPVGEVMYTHYTKCVGCHICQMVCPTGYIQMGMGDGL